MKTRVENSRGADPEQLLRCLAVITGTSAQVLLFLLCLPALVHSAADGNSTDEAGAFWQAASEPGTILLMRHALAPGNGDPVDMTIDDCSTQRNLSEEGREQARKSGELLRRHGITNVAVYSSQWCRCRETAVLLGFGDIVDLPSLNSFYATPGLRDEQTESTLAWASGLERDASIPLTMPILVTHQVNITALTNEFPASGEIFAVRLEEGGNGTLRLIARLKTR